MTIILKARGLFITNWISYKSFHVTTILTSLYWLPIKFKSKNPSQTLFIFSKEKNSMEASIYIRELLTSLPCLRHLVLSLFVPTEDVNL